VRRSVLALRAPDAFVETEIEMRLRQIDPRRQLEVQVGRGVEPGRAGAGAAVEDVPSTAAIVRDEVEVEAADLDRSAVLRETEADEGAVYVVKLEHALFGDDLGQRPVGRLLARYERARTSSKWSSDPQGAGGRVRRQHAVERGQQLGLAERTIE
jgi:hypothetical protein